MTTPSLLAIDAGNSKTDVAVVGEDGGVIAMTRGGGYRPQEIGEQAALEVVAVAVTAALDLADVAPGTVLAHVAASMANADLPDEEERLTKALHARGWSRTVRVGNDTFALLRAGAAAGWGIAVVCGAGTNCVGVGPDGRVARFPALGTITGDWGGGAHLGELALWHAIRGEDGRGPLTALTAAVATYFGVERAIDVGLGLHKGEIDGARLPELAPVLLEVAASSDAIAARIVDRQAEEIATLGAVTLRHLDLLDIPTEVVLGGGVLTARHPLLMAAIERRYAERAPHAKLVVVDAPLVLGAALLGLDHVGAPPGSYANLRASLRPRAGTTAKTWGSRT